MAVGHEKLDLYRASIASVGWASRYCEKRKGHRNAKDQRLRASQAIALKTVEGQGPRVTAKRRTGDRRRSVEIARGSALACAAIQDVLPVCDVRRRRQEADGTAR